jgi:hypothetical protein
MVWPEFRKTDRELLLDNTIAEFTLRCERTSDHDESSPEHRLVPELRDKSMFR